MSQPIPVTISDSDSEPEPEPPQRHVITTPSPKRRKTQPRSVHVIDDDDDPTPRHHPTPSDTPGGFSSSDVAIVKCTTRLTDRVSGIRGLVFLESDDDSEKGSGAQYFMQDEKSDFVSNTDRYPPVQTEKSKITCDVENDVELNLRLHRSSFSLEDEDSEQIYGGFSQLHTSGDDMTQDEKSDFVSNTDRYPQVQTEKSKITCDVENDVELNLRLHRSSFSLEDEDSEQIYGGFSQLHTSGDDMTQINHLSTEENNGCERNNIEIRSKSKATINKDKDVGGNRRRKLTEEEKIRLKEEKKQQKEKVKLQKEAMKAEAAELKKLQKEKQKWEKGKFAQKSIVAEVDTKLVELGSVAGPLLTRFAEKGFAYRITKNSIRRSIVWDMTVPDEISQLMSNRTEVSYVLLVFEAEEFCNLVLDESLMDHISSVRSRYPSHTICYLVTRLMAYINKREQAQFKNPEQSSGWRRPPIEEVLAKLTTHFVRVHSRLCVDENELAEHVVGLTSSLASCLYRKKLSRLSVNANGSLVPKDCVDKNLIKKNTWLKALVAIPKVQPRFAIAIWKKYPTMKSLLSVYMDPNKSVHEKEFLLEDLRTEVMLGDDRRLGEVCSKRVYRILMAQCGNIKTDEVEDGADLFRNNKSSDDKTYFADDLGM